MKPRLLRTCKVSSGKKIQHHVTRPRRSLIRRLQFVSMARSAEASGVSRRAYIRLMRDGESDGQLWAAYTQIWRPAGVVSSSHVYTRVPTEKSGGV